MFTIQLHHFPLTIKDKLFSTERLRLSYLFGQARSKQEMYIQEFQQTNKLTLKIAVCYEQDQSFMLVYNCIINPELPLTNHKRKINR